MTKTVAEVLKDPSKLWFQDQVGKQVSLTDPTWRKSLADIFSSGALNGNYLSENYMDGSTMNPARGLYSGDVNAPTLEGNLWGVPMSFQQGERGRAFGGFKDSFDNNAYVDKDYIGNLGDNVVLNTFRGTPYFKWGDTGHNAVGNFLQSDLAKIGSFIPGVGQVLAGARFGTALGQGDLLGAGLSAFNALGGQGMLSHKLAEAGLGDQLAFDDYGSGIETNALTDAASGAITGGIGGGWEGALLGGASAGLGRLYGRDVANTLGTDLTTGRQLVGAGTNYALGQALYGDTNTPASSMPIVPRLESGGSNSFPVDNSGYYFQGLQDLFKGNTPDQTAETSLLINEGQPELEQQGNKIPKMGQNQLAVPSDQTTYAAYQQEPNQLYY